VMALAGFVAVAAGEIRPVMKSVSVRSPRTPVLFTGLWLGVLAIRSSLLLDDGAGFMGPPH
jgi:hypothetical protein